MSKRKKVVTKVATIVTCVVTCTIAIAAMVLVWLPLQYIPAQEATCESAGHTEYYKSWFTCFKDRDGKERIDKSETIIPALGHDVNEVSAVAATCTEDGNIWYFRCSRCRKGFLDEDCQNAISDMQDIIVPATGHAEFVRYEADGSAQGQHIAYCQNKNCPGQEESCDFPERGRVENCTLDETLRRTCPLCNQVEIREHKAVTSHSWETWAEVEPATCLKEGLNIRACKNCKQTEAKTTDKLDHIYEVSENYWEEDEFVASTQNSYAKIPYHCASCGWEFGAETWSEEFAYADRKSIRIEDKNYAGTVVMFDSIIGSLGFNLSAMDNDLSNLSYNGYSRQSHILTILSTYKDRQVKETKIIGRSEAFKQLTINTQMFSNLTIILQNLSLTAVDGQPCLDLSKTNNCQLVIYGTVSLEGTNGGEGIDALNLTITGSGSFAVKGGDGKEGVRAAQDTSRGDGKNGGIGISAANLTIEMKGWLSVSGGNGGDGYDYTNKEISDGIYDGNNGDGSNGWDGFTGGEGGCAINATKIVLKSGTVSAQGGHGGEGGDAGECNRKEWQSSSKDDDVVGGRGGFGGNGGVGITTQKIDIEANGNIIAKGGAGGNSGKLGGCHKNDHKDSMGVVKWTAEDGDPGDPGKGGKGLSDECSITGNRSSISQEKGEDGTQITDHNQD